MDQWERVIVEWINCLDLQKTLKSTTELQDGKFYDKILDIISKTKNNHDCDQEDIIMFIKDQYPSFKINKADNTEHIYIASLLLMHTSQATLFHTPMCNKLKHGTQIKIKTFLENVLPLEHDITKETLKEVIIEIEEDSLKTPNRRRTPPLKDFIESPVVRSARSSYKIMTERIRELRKLRCELDVERFKNAELQDDVKTQQDKIRNLKAKLEEKSALLKTLRDERMKPSTPQCSRKKENTSTHEDYYKKYIDDMEIELKKQLDKADNLETEKDNLSKMLASIRRQCAQYKENFETSERSLEALSRDIEAKDRELIELKIYNEELRDHIKEFNRNSARDRSLKVDDSAILSLPDETMDHSEILSSVIEIQLQEVKEEAAVLRAKVDSLKEELEVRTKDYKDTLELNANLQQKVKVLDEVRAEMNDVRRELDASNVNIANLQAEKLSLVAQNENLKDSLSSKETELSETVQLNTALSTKLDNLKADVKNLSELLGNERIDSSDLSTTLEHIKSQVAERLEHIHKLTDEKESYKSSIEICAKNLKDTLNYGTQFIQMQIDNLDNVTLNNLTKYFDTMLHNCSTAHNSYKRDIETLKATVNKINADAREQKLIVANLKEQNQRTLTELADIEEDRKRKDLLLNEQRKSIRKYTDEIKILKEIESEKCILEKDMLKLKKDLISQQLLLKSAVTYLQNFQDIKRDFESMTQEVQQNFTEYQQVTATTFKEIYRNYQVLCQDFRKIEQEKEELEYNLNHTKEESTNVLTTNAALQRNLLQCENTISALEKEERFLCHELSTTKQIVQELNEAKRVLEEQCAAIKIESINNMESMKSENAKISLELKDVIEKLHLSQQEMRDAGALIELKNTQIEELFANISASETKINNLTCLHEEAIAAKDKISLELRDTTEKLHLSQQEMRDAGALIELKNTQIEELLANISASETKINNLTCLHEEAIAAKDKISLELRDTTEKLHLSQQEMRDAGALIELKNTQIEELLANISASETKMNNLTCLHEEAIAAKDKIWLELKAAIEKLYLSQQESRDAGALIELKNTQIEELLANISASEIKMNNLTCLHKEAISAKDKIWLELKDAIEKLHLSQQETRDTGALIDLKNTQIEELLANISASETKMNNLTCLHEEAIAAKNKEIESKEEALLMLQSKMEKRTSEAKDSEKKLKEVIVNLQEVRSSQDAVLATQEAALKEKCLHIEELQKQFESVKEALRRELEDEQSSHRELQVKFTELEDQINDRNDIMKELQEKLMLTSAELEASRDRCKLINASQTVIINLCQELEHPAKNLNSTIAEKCSHLDFLEPNSHDMPQHECEDEKTKDVLNTIKMTLYELHMSQKIILHLSLVNAELKTNLAEQKIQIEKSKKVAEEVCNLKNKVQEMEVIAQKRNEYLNGLIRNKESLKNALQKVFVLREELDAVLTSSQQKWQEALAKFCNLLQTDSSTCDEFKQLQANKKSLDDELFKYHVDYLQNVKYISDILWEKFLWTEKKLYDTYLCSVHEKECLDILTRRVEEEEDPFSDEKTEINMELQKNKILHADLIKSQEKVQAFIALTFSYESNLKSKEIIAQSDEKKLRGQISQLTKEKEDLKSKMEALRSRNVKLERNMDDLRVEIKKLKSETTPAIDSEEVQSLKSELERIKEQCEQLHRENNKSSETAKQHFERQLREAQTLCEQKLENMKQQLQKEKNKFNETAKQDLESQLKDVHASYERKLEDMKQKMKKAYNEQMTKLNSEQEKIIQEKLHSQMESMCQKQREEINRYKAHVGDLSSQLWSVGEKLLIEQQQKQEAMQHLKELQVKIKDAEACQQQVSTVSHQTTSLEILPENVQQMMQKMTLITEETFQRRRSIRNIAAMGNAFKAEDEEEVFDNVYLADMKKGVCLPNTSVNVDRLSVLQMRNAQCKPHLKSSYPTEMQFLSSNLTEDDIKTGSMVEDIFNDSLSQSLLPEQKVKKKDRYQTSYKKPGPPTPSKNGGRLSLQGNEMKSPTSRILRERNIDRRTTTTPHTLRKLLTLKRPDENAPTTPKGRRLSSIFRKSRLQ